MKGIKEHLLESMNEDVNGVTKSVINLKIDDKVSLPVMVTETMGRLIWSLNYLVAQQSGRGYQLYLVTEPNSKFKNNPIDTQAAGHLVPVELFDFEDPEKNLKVDFWKPLLRTCREHGNTFEEGENVRIEL